MTDVSQSCSINPVQVVRPDACEARLMMQPATDANSVKSGRADRNMQDLNLKVSQYA